MSHKIHVLSRAVIIHKNHLLVAYDPRQKPMHYYEFNAPFYYLPGGHIESKEPAEKAIVREIYEETGYDSRIECFLGILEHSWSFPGDELCCHTHEINLIFKVILKGAIRMNNIDQKEEHVAFKWVPLKQISKLDLRPEVLKNLVLQWLSCNNIHPHNLFSSNEKRGINFVVF